MRELERRFHLEGEQKLEWRCQGNMRKDVWRRKVLVYAILRLHPTQQVGQLRAMTSIVPCTSVTGNHNAFLHTSMTIASGQCCTAT